MYDIIVSEWNSLSRVWLCDPIWTIRPWNSPGQNTGAGILSLLQWIFLTQGLNWGLPHCRRILYQLSYQGSRAWCLTYIVFASPNSSRLRVEFCLERSVTVHNRDVIWERPVCWEGRCRRRVLSMTNSSWFASWLWVLQSQKMPMASQHWLDLGMLNHVTKFTRDLIYKPDAKLLIYHEIYHCQAAWILMLVWEVYETLYGQTASGVKLLARCLGG